MIIATHHEPAGVQVDRVSRRHVSNGMARSLGVILAALIAVLGACGGKDKKGKTTPGSSSEPGAAKDTELMDGESPPTGPASGDSASQSDGEAGSTSGDEAGKAGDESAGPATIEPPDLDLGAEEQKQRVARHLRAAWDSLRGTKKDPDRAIREARNALAADATSVDAVVVIAHAYYTKRLYDTAEVVLDMMYKERKAARSNPGVYYVYGLIYDRTERPEQAVLAYQKAVELAPSYRSAMVNLGKHYLRNKNYDRAISLYEQLTGSLEVKSAITWTNLGSAYRGRSADYPADSPRRNELLRKAEVAYKRALSADRSYAKAYYNLALLYFDADPFPELDGTAMDRLKRLERAKTYFDEYRTMRGADIDLVNRRTKQVNKLIKREQKRRKRAKQKKSGSDDDW